MPKSAASQPTFSALSSIPMVCSASISSPFAIHECHETLCRQTHSPTPRFETWKVPLGRLRVSLGILHCLSLYYYSCRRALALKRSSQDSHSPVSVIQASFVLSCAGLQGPYAYPSPHAATTRLPEPFLALRCRSPIAYVPRPTEGKRRALSPIPTNAPSWYTIIS